MQKKVCYKFIYYSYPRDSRMHNLILIIASFMHRLIEVSYEISNFLLREIFLASIKLTVDYATRLGVFCASIDQRGLHRVYPYQTNYNRTRLATQLRRSVRKQCPILSISREKQFRKLSTAYTLPSNLHFIFPDLGHKYLLFIYFLFRAIFLFYFLFFYVTLIF